MKILKYRKLNNNEYKIITDKAEYKLYADIIVKYELLTKKEIDEAYFQVILQTNQLFAAYYAALKAINTRLRSKKELEDLLKKKFNEKEISFALTRLEKEGYLNSKVYIEAYIHDMLTLNIVGENKILNDLLKLGFSHDEVIPLLEKINPEIYQEKIRAYITKKAKCNKKSIYEFKGKMVMELVNKGFKKEDINACLEVLDIEENEEEIAKLINKLYIKYIKKYDVYTTKQKIKASLYQKGYQNIDIEKYILKKTS